MKTDFRMNWWALPMLPFALVAALVAGLFSKPRRLSAGKMVEELEALIAFAEGAGEWDSDEFNRSRWSIPFSKVCAVERSEPVGRNRMRTR
jgi:hypothetical protein